MRKVDSFLITYHKKQPRSIVFYLNMKNSIFVDFKISNAEMGVKRKFFEQHKSRVIWTI